MLIESPFFRYGLFTLKITYRDKRWFNYCNSSIYSFTNFATIFATIPTHPLQPGYLNITVTANETLKYANITILGSTYVMNVSGAVANASVNVDQNSVEGDVLFNITAFDLAGNNFTADQTELDSSNVIIDTSSPMLDNLTIYSNNANTSLATVNNILNIAITV